MGSPRRAVRRDRRQARRCGCVRVMVKGKRTQSSAPRAPFSYACGLHPRETNAAACGERTSRYPRCCRLWLLDAWRHPRVTSMRACRGRTTARQRHCHDPPPCHADDRRFPGPPAGGETPDWPIASRGPPGAPTLPRASDVPAPSLTPAGPQPSREDGAEPSPRLSVPIPPTAPTAIPNPQPSIYPCCHPPRRAPAWRPHPGEPARGRPPPHPAGARWAPDREPGGGAPTRPPLSSRGAPARGPLTTPRLGGVWPGAGCRHAAASPRPWRAPWPRAPPWHEHSSCALGDARRQKTPCGAPASPHTPMRPARSCAPPRYPPPSTRRGGENKGGRLHDRAFPPPPRVFVPHTRLFCLRRAQTTVAGKAFSPACASGRFPCRHIVAGRPTFRAAALTPSPWSVLQDTASRLHSTVYICRLADICRPLLSSSSHAYLGVHFY